MSKLQFRWITLLIKQLLTFVQTLQSDVAALKSGATGGSNSQSLSGTATLLQTDSVVSGKEPKWLRSDEGGGSEEEPLSSDKEDDNVFILSEATNVFMEIPTVNERK